MLEVMLWSIHTIYRFQTIKLYSINMYNYYVNKKNLCFQSNYITISNGKYAVLVTHEN
jgi:hypothetical protein